jgi:hypothetical protein
MTAGALAALGRSGLAPEGARVLVLAGANYDAPGSARCCGWRGCE